MDSSSRDAIGTSKQAFDTSSACPLRSRVHDPRPGLSVSAASHALATRQHEDITSTRFGEAASCYCRTYQGTIELIMYVCSAGKIAWSATTGMGVYRALQRLSDCRDFTAYFRGTMREE